LPDAVRAVAGARLALAGRQGPLGDLCASVEARIALQLGDTTRADELASTLPHGRRQSLLRARIACRRREFGDALNHLAECRITTARESLDVGLVRARCAAELGDDAFADYLGDIAEFARHEMYVQPVVEELADCGEALARLLRAGDVGPWERRVLEHLDHPIPSASTMSDGGMNGRGLSPRELQVLRYLASRLTNAEIAQELYISLNTLRTHVAAIYRKLGVSSRRDAVEVARRLDLTRH
jgi:LuxR family maltose regulon positive regulatory protein